MKVKFRLMLAIGVLGLMTSCIKEWGCTCENIVIEGNAQHPVDSTWTVYRTVTNDKKNAEANCEYLGGTSFNGDWVHDETCTLD